MQEQTPIRVLCIDDHPLILAGVQEMLNAEPDMVFIGGARNAEDGIALFRQHMPDIALVDLRLPGLSGTVAIARIMGEFPAACLIALTTYKGDEDIHRALNAGAKSYLIKDVLHQELVEAIRTVYKGGRRIHPEAARRLV